jgi:uncharacterized membrane protein YhaH (DUF805 family)
MAYMNTGNTGFYNPNHGQLYYCGHLKSGTRICQPIYPGGYQSFAWWEVALTVVAAVVLVATVALLIRRLRAH